MSKLLLGDCLEVMRTMPDASVDAVVTDPPYGLADHPPKEVAACLAAWLAGEPYKPKGKGFMGKAWDAWVPGPEVWRECLRVLKPGGHLLAFAGTRSMDLMSMAVRLAGFELRDSIGWAHDGGGAPLLAWTYGSGFPKSLDVSKAIDKCNGETGRLLKFTEWMRTTGLAARQINKITETNMGSHYLTAVSQPAIPTPALWALLRPHCGDVPEWVDQLVQRIEAEREVVGQGHRVRRESTVQIAGCSDGAFPITAPATPEAQQWAGWGTALKPSWEPVILARKPLEGTVAANVLAHGTGGINVDGCRVGTDDKLGGGMVSMGRPKASEGWDRPWMHDPEVTERKKIEAASKVAAAEALGRWPANLIHDGSDEVVALFPAEARSSCGGGKSANAKPGYSGGFRPDHDSTAGQYYDTGSAARFFKQCKGYTKAWPNLTPEPANTAGSSFSPSRQFVAFALSDAATWALPVGSCNSLSLAPSTSATANELRQLSESVITAIQSIAPKFWQESRLAKLTLTLNHASFAVTREQTGITTITASHWKSDGSAEPVTFNITGTNTEAGDQASAPRAFYTAKASRDDRSDGNTHPTVKPTDLMRYLCRLVTPPGGIVLDPFMGSGSTGKAAMLEGFEFIGIEREAAYHAIAERRIGRAAAAGYQPSLLP